MMKEWNKTQCGLKSKRDSICYRASTIYYNIIKSYERLNGYAYFAGIFLNLGDKKWEKFTITGCTESESNNGIF